MRLRPAAGDAWHRELLINYPWHPTGGTFTVLMPEPPATEKKP